MTHPCPIGRTLTVNGEEMECLVFWDRSKGYTEIEQITLNDGKEIPLDQVKPSEMESFIEYIEYWMAQ
jgi:hypothetical protein